MSDSTPQPAQPCPLVAPGARAQPGQRRWCDAQGEHIDVRGLQPPQPLVAILHLVRALGASATAVVVHHDRDPVMLYPELAELGWSAERLPAEPGELRLRLTWVP
jgi:hypothetical protein